MDCNSSHRIVYDRIFSRNRNIALLIDPDKFTQKQKDLLRNKEIMQEISAIFLGGSLIFDNIDLVALEIKSLTNHPLILFPGSVVQLTPHVDAILFLSLISGRNPEYLIGHHVIAAPQIRRMGIEAIPTGYMLFENGSNCSVTYMSGTMPIPRMKTDIALATAIAGEMLGLKVLYLEAGSGADIPIPPEIISQIRQNISIPLIVGGGVRTKEQMNRIFDAGANLVVLGSVLETFGEEFYK